MNRKALMGLAVAILIPLVCYMILQYASTRAVDMPRHYLLDTVVTRIEKGKEISDSIWHTTANIRLQNQLGDTVSLYDKQGKILVIDFFFTRCGSICPKLTTNMSKLQQSFIRGGDLRKKIDTSIVQFISMSVDPERDSVPVLKAYADRYRVNHDNWWMLTGKRDSIYRFAFEELRVDKFDETPISPEFVHTNRFVLLDKEYRVRGYYNGLDTVSLSKLARDIGLLMLEKDRTKQSAVFTEIIDLKWIWAIVILAVIFFVAYMTRRRNANG